MKTLLYALLHSLFFQSGYYYPNIGAVPTAAVLVHQSPVLCVATPCTVTLSSTAASGNTMIVAFGQSASGAPDAIISVTGSDSNAFTSIVTSQVRKSAEIWCRANIGALTSLTVTYTAVPSGTVNAMEFTNAYGCTALTTNTTSNGGVSPIPSASVSPSKTALIVTTTRYSGATLTAGPDQGYTALSTPQANAYQAAYILMPAATGSTTNWTYGGGASSGWDTVTAAFQHN